MGVLVTTGCDLGRGDRVELQFLDVIQTSVLFCFISRDDIVLDVSECDPACVRLRRRFLCPLIDVRMGSCVVLK